MRRRLHLERLELDGSTADDRLAKAGNWLSCRDVDLRDLAPALRLWARARTIAQARERLRVMPTPPDPVVTLIGSGDFHHLAPLLLERVREPVTLVHFDNHPDWVRLAPRWHCGSWINQALRNERVARIVTIGPCSDDLAHPDLKGGNLPALASGRLRLFPWSRPPSRVLRKMADGPSWRHADGHLHWRNLADLPAAQARALILEQIATTAVWLSIDKDVLPETENISNWDQGRMPLQAVLDLIGAIVDHHELAGADICGEHSPPQFDSLLKRWEVRRDQPRRAAPDAAARARNIEVTCRLLATIAGDGGRC